MNDELYIRRKKISCRLHVNSKLLCLDLHTECSSVALKPEQSASGRASEATVSGGSLSSSAADFCWATLTSLLAET